MREIFRQWMYTVIGALAVGPIAGDVASSVRGVGGSPHATGLLAESPVGGMFKMLICVSLAGLTMVAGAWLGFTRRALFVGGIVLSWSALRAGTVEGVIRATEGGGVYPRLAIEGAVLGALFVFFLWVVGRIRRRADASFVLPSGRDVRAVLVFVISGIVLGWAVAQDGSGGQTLLAAFAAGLLGTLLARVVEPGSSILSAGIGAVALAVLAPIVWSIAGRGSSLAAMYEGDIAGYALISPMTWLAGVSMGIWGGASWSDSVVKKHDTGGAPRASRPVARG